MVIDLATVMVAISHFRILVAVWISFGTVGSRAMQRLYFTRGSSIAVHGKPNTRVYRRAHANGLARSASYFLVCLLGQCEQAARTLCWTQLLDLGAPTRTSRDQA
jgi:hypothetical protein